MILQALNNYYARLKDNADVDIPCLGFSSQKIHFALLLNRDGNLLQILDLRETQGNRLLPKQMIVPQEMEERSGTKLAPHFTWDNTMYVLGNDNKKKSNRALRAFEEFKKFHYKLGDDLDDDGMIALLRFLDSWKPEDAPHLAYWDEMAGMNLVFKLDGDLQRYIHGRPKIQEIWLKYYREIRSNKIATCLVSGKPSPIARIHPAIKNVKNAQPKGAAIVSFNKDSFVSYGKVQNFNAPVSEDITFNYTTALNYLLRSDSRQKVQIGDAATVFWTERDSPVEGFMGLILNPQDDSGDIKEIRDLLDAVRAGRMPSDLGDPDIGFYILGLSPNASRLSIRFWHVSTVGDISAKIGQHFSDLAIIKNYDNDPNFPGIWQLLRETAVLRKPENISPILSGSIMRSIVTGAAYPQSLMTAIIGRIRAEQSLKNKKGKTIQNVSYIRVAIIKAYLVRKYRINRISKEITMALDKESTDIAYRLGRLFAVLEKAQRDAIPGANTTIKDSFYGAASATPRTVFPRVLRLVQHHIQKAEYGRNTDKMIEEIMQDIQAFPAHLNLDEQGMFAIGYYHQRQSFYVKSDKKEKSNE